MSTPGCERADGGGGGGSLIRQRKIARRAGLLQSFSPLALKNALPISSLEAAERKIGFMKLRPIFRLWQVELLLIPSVKDDRKINIILQSYLHVGFLQAWRVHLLHGRGE